MATSPKSMVVVLSVEATGMFKRLYGHRIGEGKEFKNKSRAFNDMIKGIFLEYYRE